MTKLKQALRKQKRLEQQKAKTIQDNTRESKNIRHDLNAMDANVTNALNKPAQLNQFLSNPEIMAAVDTSKVETLVNIMNTDVNRLAHRLDDVRKQLNTQPNFISPKEKQVGLQIALQYNDILDDYTNTVDSTVHQLAVIFDEAAKTLPSDTPTENTENV